MLPYNKTVKNRREEIDLTALICLTKSPKLLESSVAQIMFCRIAAAASCRPLLKM